MKLMLKFSIPVKKGNSSAADGSMIKALKQLKKDVNAEAFYLFVEQGKRSGIVIFDETNSERMLEINEPLFAAVDAEIEITPVGQLDDLMKVI